MILQKCCGILSFGSLFFPMQNLLFSELSGCFFQLAIPIFAETGNEWFTQELIKGQLEFFPQIAPALADVPAMVVDTGHTAFEFLETERVEPA